MKKLLAIVLAMVMILSLAACASKPADNTKPSDTKSTDNTTKATEPKTTDAAKTDVTIELWTYPVGNWGNEAEVAKLTDAFTAETGIKVKVEYLAYHTAYFRTELGLAPNSYLRAQASYYLACALLLEENDAAGAVPLYEQARALAPQLWVAARAGAALNALHAQEAAQPSAGI